MEFPAFRSSKTCDASASNSLHKEFIAQKLGRWWLVTTISSCSVVPYHSQEKRECGTKAYKDEELN